MSSFGFILLRHVRNSNDDKLWIQTYNCIRKFFPDTNIVIIDDNSNKNAVSNINLFKTFTIYSDFPARGELLPYYYFLHNKFFDKAIIIHDSVFINDPSRLLDVINNPNIHFCSLWNFPRNVCFKKLWSPIKKCFKHLNRPPNFENFIRSGNWAGCYGGMSIVSHDFVIKLNKTFNFTNLTNCITSRTDRMAFERILGSMTHFLGVNNCLFNSILKYCPWGLNLNTYSSNPSKYDKLPLVKIWSGR